jgi:hypothetical protein
VQGGGPHARGACRPFAGGDRVLEPGDHIDFEGALAIRLEVPHGRYTRGYTSAEGFRLDARAGPLHLEITPFEGARECD